MWYIEPSGMFSTILDNVCLQRCECKARKVHYLIFVWIVKFQKIKFLWSIAYQNAQNKLQKGNPHPSPPLKYAGLQKRRRFCRSLIH